MADVQLSGLTKAFGGITVIPGLDLQVPHGSFTVLVGPSGCGKSTLLRMIAGLESQSAGEIRIGGTDVTDAERSARVAETARILSLQPYLDCKPGQLSDG